MIIVDYTKHIDNHDFIDHIVKIQCVKCNNFFVPDKTKPIRCVCDECRKIPEPEVKTYHTKFYPLTNEERMERKRAYNREYSKTYYRKFSKNNRSTS